MGFCLAAFGWKSWSGKEPDETFFQHLLKNIGGYTVLSACPGNFHRRYRLSSEHERNLFWRRRSNVAYHDEEEARNSLEDDVDDAVEVPGSGPSNAFPLGTMVRLRVPHGSRTGTSQHS